MTTLREPSRGFTLVELMVALAISVVVIAGSLMLLNAQRRSFQGGSVDRALQEAGRVALIEISGNLRLAGYGLDTPDEAKTVPGGGVIGGIGFVAGIRCMIAASDSARDSSD